MLKQALKRIIPFFMVLALLLSVLSSCADNNDAKIPPDNNDVLTLYGIDPHTLDPAISGDSTSHQYVTQIFSGLFRLNDLLEPRPDIASDWEVSDDGTKYTIHLRKDVTFHDGTPVTASDFKYSWERTCNPATGSQTAETYLGDIVGVREMLAGEATEISGVQVVDKYTIEITIDAPRSYFLYKLTYPTTFVIDKNNVNSGSYWWHNPNGTGPFELKKWDEGEKLVLEWNDRYYGDWPKLSSVVFLLWGGVPIVMYETGEIDVTGVPVSYIDKVTDPAETFYNELTIYPELSFYYIGFNTTEPPFDNRNVRKAFSLAIDREKIASLIFRDMVEPAYGIIPTGMPGYSSTPVENKYDPVKARKLIEESPYGDVANLPPITLTNGGWGGLISRELEAIIDQWEKNLGVEIEVRQLEPERYIYNLREEKDQLFDIGWIADYPHPQNFLTILFNADSKNNYGEYNSTEADSLLDEAGREQDAKASFDLYRQAEDIMVDDAACIPLWFGENYYLVKPYVSGYYLNPLGIVMLDEVSIDKG